MIREESFFHVNCFIFHPRLENCRTLHRTQPVGFLSSSDRSQKELEINLLLVPPNSPEERFDLETRREVWLREMREPAYSY